MIKLSHMTSRTFHTLLLFLFTALALSDAWLRRWVCDDAFISFRHAEHLANGLGLVYNPGEYVEGYTNFLDPSSECWFVART